MNQEHVDKNIIARKRKARKRKAHLRRLQGAYDRMFKEYGELFNLYMNELISKNIKKKWYQFWK